MARLRSLDLTSLWLFANDNGVLWVNHHVCCEIKITKHQITITYADRQRLRYTLKQLVDENWNQQRCQMSNWRKVTIIDNGQHID